MVGSVGAQVCQLHLSCHSDSTYTCRESLIGTVPFPLHGIRATCLHSRAAYAIMWAMALIDSLDRQLISLLADNARQTSEALARQLGVNPSTVRRRLQGLVKNKVIRIAALPDPDMIGLSFRAVVGFDVVHEKLDSVVEQLRLRPEVQWLSVTTGRFDVIAIVWFPSSEEFFTFMQTEVGALDGVKDTETFVCLHTRKM